MPKPSTHLESEVPARKGDKSQKKWHEHAAGELLAF